MSPLQVLATGVPHLDPVLGGGVPLYSLNIVAGPPGAGKTVLVQQMLFHYIRTHDESTALYLTTLSEPTLKMVRYMQQYSFFDPEAFGERVLYQDLGRLLHERPLNEVGDCIVGYASSYRSSFLVIDSFKAIHDLATDPSAFRRFCYDLSVRLASARCTTFFVGEYESRDVLDGVEFAVADGIVYLDRRLEEGGDQRFLQVYKMRGQAAEMAPFPFTVSRDGVSIQSLAAAVIRTRDGAADNESLSHREREVVRLIAQGMTNQEIAERLLLSLNTIKTHRLRIYQKLGFSSRSELVNYAMNKGLFDKKL